MPNTESLKKDFDELARIYHPKWSHSIHYYNYLSKLVPGNCKTILDIGCGNGDFARLISGKAEKIIGVDISPEKIAQAESLSKKFPNIEYEAINVFHKNILPGSFDCVISISTFHHFPLENVLRKSMEWLKKDGTLLVLDVYKPRTILDYIYSFIAIIPDLIINFIKNSYIRKPKKIRIAWNNHRKNDRIISYREVCKAAFRTSATVKVHRHLFWRYSIICRKTK
jgi:SAM-dependent methyltransferase